MTTEAMLALIFLIMAFTMFIPPKIPYNRFGRAGIALIFGAAMLLFGLLHIEDIPKYLNVQLLLLLLGMMLLVAGLEAAGFFDAVTDRLTARETTRRRFLAEIMVITAALSALMLNDAVVLLMTPVVIKCCSRFKANPVPYLIGVFVSSNIGSVATAIGNPHNAYIATKAGIGFLDFIIAAAPAAAVSLGIAIVFMLIINRKELTEVFEKDVSKMDTVIVDGRRLKIMLSVLFITVFMFTVSDYVGLRLYQVAIASGFAALAISSLWERDGFIRIAKKVNWSILVFFVGLFMIMGGVVESGLLADMSLFFGFGSGNVPPKEALVGFTALLSNLVSNVPSVMLIGEMLPPDPSYWMTLAISSTLAGNATLLGAAANIIVAEEAGKYGVNVEFLKALKSGLPIALATLVFSTVYVVLIL